MNHPLKGFWLIAVLLGALPMNQSRAAYTFAPTANLKSVATGGIALYVVRISSQEANDDTLNLYRINFNNAWHDTLFYDTVGTVPLYRAPDRNGDGLTGDIIVPAQNIPTEFAYFGYKVYAPDTALAFTIDTCWVYGRSRLDQTFIDTAWFFTSVLPAPRVQIAVDSADSILAGTYIDYPLTVSNLSNYPDTIDLAYVNGLQAQGWTVTLLDSTGAGRLPDNNGDGYPDLDALRPFTGQAKFIARIQSPASSVAGTVDTVLVIARNNFVKGTKDTVMLITAVKTVAQLALLSDAADSTLGGQTVQYPLTVINGGSAPDIVDLGTSFSMSAWVRNMIDTTGAVLRDNNNNGQLDIGPVPPHGGRMRFFVRVTPIANAVAGSIDTTNVTAYSTTIPGVTAAVSLKTLIKTAPGVAIAPNGVDSCEAGANIRYPLDVINSGNGPDYINISLTKGHPAWPTTIFAADGTTLLVDNNSDGTVDIGRPAGFGTVTRIWVELRPPANTPNPTYDTTRVVAASVLRPALQSTATLRTKVYVGAMAGIEIGPPFSSDTTDTPGAPVDFQLWARNSGNIDDTLTLAMTGGAWTDTLLDASGGPLGYLNAVPSLGVVAPGDTVRFLLRITPPAFFGAGNPTTFEQRLLVVHSQFDPALSDTAEVDLKVIPPLTVYNYPNPFPTTTTFFFSLPEPGTVSLKVFDQVGAHVGTLIDRKAYTTGAYLLPWNATSVSGKRLGPGVYVWVFTFDGTALKKEIVKKAVLSQ